MAKLISNLYIVYQAFEPNEFKSFLDYECTQNKQLAHLRKDGLLDFDLSLINLLDQCGI